jgi:hypothetical protein
VVISNLYRSLPTSEKTAVSGECLVTGNSARQACTGRTFEALPLEKWRGRLREERGHHSGRRREERGGSLAMPGGGHTALGGPYRHVPPCLKRFHCNPIRRQKGVSKPIQQSKALVCPKGSVFQGKGD